MPPPAPLKKLERGWKRLVFGTIGLYLRAMRPPPPITELPGGPRRVLFLRQDRIGDAIVSTGLLRAIASLSPETELDVLASPRNAAIISRFPFVRHVHLFDKRRPSSFPALWRSLRMRRYDVVIDCMVTAPSLTGLLLMLASGARHRLGVGGRGVDWGLTVPIYPPGGHIIRLYSEFIRPFGIEPESRDWRPRLELSEEERAWGEALWPPAHGRVLVNVSAGEPVRAWPDDRYVAVIRAITTHRPAPALLVIGAPAEWDRVTAIASATGTRAVPTPSIQNLMALVATAELVVTPDTSVVHVASAFGKPTVSMYIEGRSEGWGPYGVDSVAVEGRGETIATLEAGEVIAAMEPFLRRLTDHASGIGGRAGTEPDRAGIPPADDEARVHVDHRHHHRHEPGSANAHMNQRPFEAMVAKFDSPERDEWQRYDGVVRWLGDLDGRRVMDLGSGTGTFALRLLDAGADVIAGDTDERFRALVGERAAGHPRAAHLEIRALAADSAGTAPGELDLVLMVNVYHHLEDRVRYLRELREGLAEAGRVVVIEFRKDAPVGPPPELKMEPSEVVDELAAAGLTVRTIDTDLLPYQYIVEAVR